MNDARTSLASSIGAAVSARAPRVRSRLAVIVPCCNEADSLAKLSAELVRLRAALAERYDVELILVDDGSTDQTWILLQDFFGGQREVQLVRHPSNRGLAAAIRTGLTQTTADVAASLDADCTYDPLQLVPMLDLLAPDVDLVVASPYHPAGEVRGVPAWRLALSRLASRLYGAVMRNRLHTYTSCVRIYRRSSVIGLPPTSGGFVGIVELIWQLDRRGGKIVEYPAILTARQTGRSKMRVARAALTHSRLLATAAWLRLWERGPPRVARNRATESRLKTRPHV
jgi:dolichol-phosphate mannosyltransferase